MKDLSKFPQLPVTFTPFHPSTLCALIIYCYSAWRNETLTTVPTVTSCLTPPLATVCHHHLLLFYHVKHLKILITKLPSYIVTKSNFFNVLPTLPGLALGGQPASWWRIRPRQIVTKHRPVKHSHTHYTMTCAPTLSESDRYSLKAGLCLTESNRGSLTGRGYLSVRL